MDYTTPISQVNNNNISFYEVTFEWLDDHELRGQCTLRPAYIVADNRCPNEIINQNDWGYYNETEGYVYEADGGLTVKCISERGIIPKIKWSPLSF